MDQLLVETHTCGRTEGKMKNHTLMTTLTLDTKFTAEIVIQLNHESCWVQDLYYVTYSVHIGTFTSPHFRGLD